MRRSLSREAGVYSTSRRSSALIITLFFVVLMTILLVGFLTSMRLETFTARSHLSGVIADLYAQAGTDAALTRLHAATGSPTNFWVTQPGGLYVSPSSTLVDLSSGAETNGASASADEAVNLNPSTLQSGSSYLIVATNATMPSAPMYVRWIYQRQDGTLDTTVPSAGNLLTSNPVVGRYAFWVDDEASKINLNTAWNRNTNVLANPSRVNLTALSPLSSTDANAIQTYRTNNSYFNSLDDARQVNATVAAMLATNNFAVTTYSHAPELNMFGEPRILLTTQKWLADAVGTTNFLDVLATESTANSGSGHVDPAMLGTLDATKVGIVVRKITSELTRTDWPILPGQSFAAKYNGQTDPAQIAMNIIDYVRSAESTSSIVVPLRGTVTGGTDFSLVAGGGTRMGLSRHPVISEFGVWFSTPVLNSGNALYKFTATVKVKITLPPNYGLKSVDLSQVFLNGHITFPSNFGSYTYSFVTAGPIAASEVSTGSTILAAGQSVTVVRGLQQKSTYPYSTLPPSVNFQPVLDLQMPGQTAGQTTNTLYVADLAGAGLSVPVTTGPITTMPSMAINDPSVSEQDVDWPKTSTATFYPPAGNSNPYGPSPICTTNTPTSTTPPQDTDDAAGQKITDAGMHLPAPQGPPDSTGQTTNPLGMVYSVAELGYIHTGVDGATGVTGVPWRTLRLQPESAASTTLPDWAMLDLFYAPFSALTADAPFIYPGNTTNSYVNVGGKININSTIASFTDGSGATLLTRTQPLQALLLGASLNGSSTVTSGSVSNLVSNITSHTLASGGRSFANTSIYYTPGQLAEIKGIADSGEASEALIRETASLATTRGNVFSIYSVGQALKQDPNGSIHVLGERRTQKIYERVYSSGTIMFLPVFSKDLQP